MRNFLRNYGQNRQHRDRTGIGKVTRASAVQLRVNWRNENAEKKSRFRCKSLRVTRVTRIAQRAGWSASVNPEL